YRLLNIFYNREKEIEMLRKLANDLSCCTLNPKVSVQNITKGFIIRFRMMKPVSLAVFSRNSGVKRVLSSSSITFGFSD
ncbi:MAG: hypothetical protein U9P81_06905, partial [Euryarchaeota archaeon]|nr:hypothetical protein [Euryarchaeota archaeon]